MARRGASGYDGCAMSLLQRGPFVLDDAARGEEFTKGSSHLVIATVIATVLVTIAVASYFIAGQKTPPATGEVVSVVAHPMHRDTTGIDASGARMPKEEFDQLLVFTHVKLHNQSKNPLFLRQVLTNIRLADGSIRSSYAAIPMDYDRVFQAYPELASLHGKSLTTDATIQPGTTLEGDFVAAFRMTFQEFDQRKALNYNVSFRYVPDLVVTPKMAVKLR
jgi:hypothetical protein